MTDIDIPRLRELAKAATPGPWDFDYDGESIEVNAGTARTTWTENGTGFPARAWATRDRILERDVYDMEEDEADEMASDAEYIAAVSPDVLIALLDRLEAAEGTVPEFRSEGEDQHG